jgi:succinate dehydrogenase/fumarate reductase flavoprotein subunit
VTPLSQRRFDWKTISAAVSIAFLSGSLVFGYAAGTTETKETVKRHEESLQESKAKIEKLNETKADKEDLKRLEDKLDKQNDKLDRILMEVAKRKS